MSNNKGSKKARLSAARLSAVQTVYQMRFGNHSAIEAARDYLDNYAGMVIDEEKLLEPDRSLFSKIVQGVDSRKGDLQDILNKSLDAENKQTEALLESIILCGIYELLAHNEIDVPIIISDYINVTYAFYDKKEAGLVNAVLDKVAKNLQSDTPE